jgi:hypothetical protein
MENCVGELLSQKWRIFAFVYKCEWAAYMTRTTHAESLVDVRCLWYSDGYNKRTGGK